MVRCVTCKGLKKVNGLGGIQRDCNTCDGTGKTEQVAIIPDNRKDNPFIVEHDMSIIDDAIDTSVEHVDKTPEIVQESKKKEVEAEIDEITAACLAELSMNPIDWKNKFINVPGLFAKSIVNGAMEEAISKVQRADIRATYAASKPIAPRVVDLSKAQDAAGRHDADYLAYKNAEKARLKK